MLRSQGNWHGQLNTTPLWRGVVIFVVKSKGPDNEFKARSEKLLKSPESAALGHILNNLA